MFFMQITLEKSTDIYKIIGKLLRIGKGVSGMCHLDLFIP
jgi:hypothetical protein